LELRENLITSSNQAGYADPPPEGKERVTVMGEIVSAVGFDRKDLCVFYEMLATESWEFDDFNSYDTVVSDNSGMNMRESITHFSRGTIRPYGDHNVYVSNFSFPFDF